MQKPYVIAKLDNGSEHRISDMEEFRDMTRWIRGKGKARRETYEMMMFDELPKAVREKLAKHSKNYLLHEIYKAWIDGVELDLILKYLD
jgi:hypothetical protein